MYKYKVNEIKYPFIKFDLINFFTTYISIFQRQC